MAETVCETPIYDAMLGQRSWPDVPGYLPCHNWEIFGELSNLLGPRETDGTVNVRYVRVDPHADNIADVITYHDVGSGWQGMA